MSIKTITCEDKAIENNLPEGIAKANIKLIEYLYKHMKQINNNVLPQFNTTMS